MKGQRVLGIVISLIMAMTMTATVPTTVFGSDGEGEGNGSGEPAVVLDNEQEPSGQEPGGDPTPGETQKAEQMISFSNEVIAEAIENNEPVELVFGDEVSLGASAEGDLSYESSDSDVISVDQETGAVTGEGVGEATVTVSAAATDEFEAAEDVLITFEVVQAEQEITINDEVKTDIVFGETVDLEATAEGILSFASDDETVVTVDEGVVTGTGVGTATVTINAAETTNYKSATKEVAFNVGKADQEIVFSPSVEEELIENDNVVAVAKGETRDLQIEAKSVVTGEETGLISFIDRTSSDNNITVDENGKITVSEAEEVEPWELTVYALSDAAYNSSSRTITIVAVDGYDGCLPEKVSGLNARATKVYRMLVDGEWTPWAEATQEIIDRINSYAEGIISIYMPDMEYTINGSKYVKETQKITVSQDEITLAYEETQQISAYAKTAIAYESNDTDIVTVDDDGLLEGVGVGTAEVTLTTESDNWYKAAKPVVLPVTVTKGMHTIDLETTSYTKVMGEESFSLNAALPEGDNRALSYGSSNEDVVAVDDDGIVTIVGTGEATVTISAEGNELFEGTEATVTITVMEATQTINVVSSITKTIGEGPFPLNVTIKDALGNDLDSTPVYTSSNTNVATVDSTGSVRILATGSTQITVTAPEKGCYQKAAKVVTLYVNGLAKPTLTVQAIGKRKIKLTWTASPGATAYQVYTYANKKTTTMTGKVVEGNSNLRTITNNKLKKRKKYKYKVRAIVTVNGTTYYSKWSAKKKAKCK